MDKKLYGGPTWSLFRLTPEVAEKFAEFVSADGHTTPAEVHAEAARRWQHHERLGPAPENFPEYSRVGQIIEAVFKR